MNDRDRYSDQEIRDILLSVRSIAIVGASANKVRPSYFVATYMVAKGYDVAPINPGSAGTEIADSMTYASLADLPGPVDMVDYFRKPEFLPNFAAEIMHMPELPRIVWMQLGIRDEAVASALEMAGIKVIQNRCPKIEYARLCGEIGWCGFNRRVISSKKPKLKSGYQHFSLGEDHA
ncbi:MAG: CoA-binding protein [Rhizobiaceae bacterium]|nr:CoA-binding protein [Rhizobiaceae bacterium]